VATANDVCGVGVAFGASVSGLRILGGPSHDAMEAHALTYQYHDNHISSDDESHEIGGEGERGGSCVSVACAFSVVLPTTL
jgi:hypothetical protein